MQDKFSTHLSTIKVLQSIGSIAVPVHICRSLDRSRLWTCYSPGLAVVATMSRKTGAPRTGAGGTRWVLCLNHHFVDHYYYILLQKLYLPHSLRKRNIFPSWDKPILTPHTNICLFPHPFAYFFPFIFRFRIIFKVGWCDMSTNQKNIVPEPAVFSLASDM